ncbi:MAG: ABC transporter ATP-binding protein [Crocinitomicaceae bacterium]|nr:ABC transporter ATP-binding protein [Crocinitomicaceae bacterium]
MVMSIIETKNLNKIYNADTVPVYALNNVNIQFDAGEFTCVIGPSGSGKTTLLNMIGGLDTPTSGEVIVANQEVTQLTGSARIDFRLHHIGFVFQHFNLIPVLTAYENAAFVMQMQGRSEAEIKERVTELLTAVGLKDKMNSRPAQLSGGEQQRVAVVRAMASKPKFILADEPTANLDSVAAFNLLDIMAKLNEEEGITFIFSTHDQRVIDRARRVVKMVDGKIDSDEVMKS